MITVDEALGLILDNQKDYGTELVHLSAAHGRVLATDIFADRDFPPFDRVAMDGIAIQYAAFQNGQVALQIEDIQAAGHPQKTLKHANHCLEVMTGAALPLGADTVIPYEDCNIANGCATIQKDVVKFGQNIHLQGSDCRNNDLLISKGTLIPPAVVGVLATVGSAKVLVQKCPSIAICSTGDELVDIEEIPLPYQIRKSNVHMLQAALAAVEIQAKQYHLPDDKEKMKMQLSLILKVHDIILFSGAVSKGKYDYLPQVLDEVGMRTIFHRVAQRPGKPFLFGRFNNGVLAFGFPGNPVSTLVCYKIFFEAWLSKIVNISPKKLEARLGEDVIFKPELTYHLLVTINIENGALIASPVRGSGSGDLLSIAFADGVLSLPAERNLFKKGEVFPLTLLSKNLQAS